MRRLSALALVALAAAPLAAQGAPAAAPAAGSWTIDLAHSDITFRIRHLVAKVPGTFNQWTAKIAGEPPAWAPSAVEVTIDAASIDTRNERRDNDLRSENFFDVAKFPTITFRSTKVEVQGTRLTITGDLTIKGITKPVVLTGEYTGMMGAGARTKVGFSASTTINRLDWGITWNRAVEGGGVVLGDEVTIDINVEAARG